MTIIKISERQIAAFEAAMTPRRRSFDDWIEAQRAIIGDADFDHAAGPPQSAYEEARQSGIDDDQRLFVYLAARMLMREMTGIQYFKVMDAVFAPISDAEKMRRILVIRGEPNG